MALQPPHPDVSARPSLAGVEQGSVRTVLESLIATTTQIQRNLENIHSQFPLGPEALQRVAVRTVSELPETGQAGEIIFNEGDSKHYGHNGTEWKALY